MVALLPSFQLLATFCSLAFAAPASHLAHRETHAHTHHVRTLPNGLQLRAYHPRSTFELFDRGIDHPLSKRGEPVSVRDAGMSFLNDRLGGSATWRSSFARNGTSSHIYAYQEVNGVPVVNAVAAVNLNKNNKVVSWSQNFVNTTKIASANPKLTTGEAETKAAKLLSGKSTGRATALKYYALEDGSLALTHSVELKLPNDHTVRAFVNADSGKMEGMFDYTNNLSFRVSPINSQDPSEGLELLQDPEDLEASPDGWNTVDGQQTGQLLGNNAVSFVNADPTNGVGAESSTGVFDFNLDLTQDPTAGENQDAAMTNAFVAVNTAHDIFFRYGFTEEAFNFQQSNFGLGGVEGDAVMISVQDPSGTDNAQFTTLEDGSQGLMQMFLFTGDPEKDGATVNAVVVHEMTHGLSNRLTGGGTANCLSTLESGGLGEGWSDAFAEWTEQTSGTIEDFEVGSFLFAGGIRNFPYSTNKTTNPLLFSDVATLDEVHNIGEVWAETLHIVHDGLIKANGFTADANTNPDGSGGNVQWLHLLIDALALQPCNPTFLDARAAWIQADVNRFNGANACTLWTGFATMGLGPDAVAGVNDFDVPVSCGGNGSEVASTGDGSAAAGAGAAAGTTTPPTGNGGNGRGRGRGRGGRGRNGNFESGRHSHKH